MRSAHTVVVLAAALALAAPATALEPGVFLDPGSPAGKEYSFPLSALRGEAVGHPAPAGAAEPLFGVGINPTARAGTGSAVRGSAKSSATRGHRRAGGSSQAAAGSGAAVPRTRRPATELASLVRPSSVVPQIALIAVALVLLGVAFGAGIAVARRRS